MRRTAVTIALFLAAFPSDAAWRAGRSETGAFASEGPTGLIYMICRRGNPRFSFAIKALPSALPAGDAAAVDIEDDDGNVHRFWGQATPDGRAWIDPSQIEQLNALLTANQSVSLPRVMGVVRMTGYRSVRDMLAKDCSITP